MDGNRQKVYALASLALVIVIFVAAIMASNALLRGVRLDLTEDGLFTLADGTRKMLRNIDEPINLYLYFSDKETADAQADFQFLRSYETRVTELLGEFVAESNGELSLEIIDPEPFSEDEDRAAEYGLTDISGGLLGDSLYFGLAGTNSVGDQAVIAVFDPAKEASLEYDLARLIYSLSKPQKTVVGLLSGVPMAGGFNPQTQQPSQPWAILNQVKQLFEVRELSTSLAKIDDDINVLWIVHPTGLDDATLYAIDQYVMHGGRALIFVDPFAQTVPGGGAPGPFGGGGGPTSSDLGPLFDAWGIRYDPAEVVADNANALQINTGQSRRPVRHIGYIGLTDQSGIASDEVVTAGLTSVNLATAGSLSAAEGADITFAPLLSSSTDSEELPAARFQFLSDPATLLDNFTPTGEAYVLAARIQGKLKSAYPDGPPAGAAPPADAAAPMSETDNGNMIVVADVDMLNDMLWVSRQRGFLGQQLMTAFANNGDFVTNAISNLSGSADLIGLKSRAGFARPFTRVDELRRAADARFRATEQQLQAQLNDTEQRLGELQAARDDTGSLLMTPEQQAEVERFRDEQLRIRRELRDVQHELDSSIDNLGTALKIINIGVVPLALALFAVLVYFARRARRSAAT